MKRVLIHSKGQSSFDSLTAINKNRVSSAFARLYVHGLEASPLSQIRWVNEDQFELLVPRVPNDIDLIQGTRIQASVESDVIKIHNILNVTRSSSLMKKAYTREFTNHVDGFELIDESWFDKVIADPFVKKAFDESKNAALIFDGEERYRFTEDLLYSSTMIVAAQRLVEKRIRLFHRIPLSDYFLTRICP